MRMANKTNVNANKEAETVEEVKAVDDAPVTDDEATYQVYV